MIHFEDLSFGKGQINKFPKNKEQLMLQKAMSGDISGTLRYLEEIMVWMAVNYKEDTDKIKATMVELYIQVKRHLPEGELVWPRLYQWSAQNEWQKWTGIPLCQ